MPRSFVRPATLCLLAGLAGGPAGAETWYRWVDAQGLARFDREAPPLATSYQTVQVPDPVRWSYAPPMPAEVAEPAELARTALFRADAPSVYAVLGVNPQGLDGSGFTVVGSAVAVSEEYALTNCHVLAAAGESAWIGTDDPARPASTSVVASDVVADRCVLRVSGLTLAPVPGVRRFDTLEVGETVYAIGNPRRLQRSLSDGLVSGVRVINRQSYVQTTAPISPGSSGGGLFDARGNLLGITSMSLRGAQAINFAIPAEAYWHEVAQR